MIDIKCIRAAELHIGICRGVPKSEIADAKHLSINLGNDIRSLWLLGLYVALACSIGVDMGCVWLRNISPFCLDTNKILPSNLRPGPNGKGLHTLSTQKIA